MANHNSNGTTVIGAPNSFANSLQTGCGKSTHVEGTNGGTMPCGARFNGEPYYCAICEEKRRLFWSPLSKAVNS